MIWKMKAQLDEGAYLPERAHDTDAGADLRTPERFILRANSYKVVDTGVHVEIPSGYAGFIKSKSGLMANDGITVDGLLDSGYSGSIRVCLFNHSGAHKEFEAGDKIAQLVILPIELPYFTQVEQIEGGERGAQGFGSTGR